MSLFNKPLILCVIVFLSHSISAQSNGCGNNPPGAPGSTRRFDIEYDGQERRYIVHQPLSYNRNTITPVIFAFPGYTITANYFSNYFGMNQHTDSLENGYLAVYVQATSFQPPTGEPIISWNDIGCSGSPGPEGMSSTSAKSQA